MSTLPWLRKLALAIGAWTLIGTGCSGGPANLRVVQASPNAPALDVFVRSTNSNQQLLFTNLAYTATTPYATLHDEGNFVVELRPAGAAATSTPILVSDEFHLHHGEQATAVIAGVAGSGDPLVQLRVLVEEEQFVATTTGTGVVRVLNASPDSPTIVVSAAGGNFAFGTVARFTASAEAGVVVPSGQPIQLNVSSPDAPVPLNTAFIVPALPAGAQSFVVITGLASVRPSEADAFNLIQIEPVGTAAVVQQNPFVYPLHVSPDAPAIDLFSGSTLLASNLTFAQLPSPIQLAPGNYSVAVFAHSPSGTLPPGSPIGTIELSGLQAGQTYLEVISGFVVAGRTPPLTGATYIDGFTIQPGTPMLRVIQASPVAANVTMGTVGSGPFVPIANFENLAFLASSPPPGTVVPATFTLGVAPVQTVNVMAEFHVTLRSDERAFGVTAGVPQPSAGEHGLVLVLIDTNPRPWVSTTTPNTK